MIQQVLNHPVVSLETSFFKQPYRVPLVKIAFAYWKVWNEKRGYVEFYQKITHRIYTYYNRLIIFKIILGNPYDSVESKFAKSRILRFHFHVFPFPTNHRNYNVSYRENRIIRFNLSCIPCVFFSHFFQTQASGTISFLICQRLDGV